MADKRCVILLVKLPEKGKVKTRLGHRLAGDVVLRLYECMVLDTIDMLKQAHAPFRICFDPPGELDRVRQWLGRDYLYFSQNGDGLGERMEQAFKQVFSEGSREVLLIGSDIPGLTVAMLDDAFRSFVIHDAVIGPAHDGGYYLIGFKKRAFLPVIFRDMLWSTGSVFRETLERLYRASLSVYVLPECIDVDTVDDLRKLLVRLDEQGTAGSRTREFLKQYHSSIEIGDEGTVSFR